MPPCLNYNLIILLFSGYSKSRKLNWMETMTGYLIKILRYVNQQVQHLENCLITWLTSNMLLLNAQSIFWTQMPSGETLLLFNCMQVQEFSFCTVTVYDNVHTSTRDGQTKWGTITRNMRKIWITDGKRNIQNLIYMIIEMKYWNFCVS